MEQQILFVEQEEGGLRLDVLLANRYKGSFSRTYFQNLIEKGLVLVNGAPMRKREKPKEGDEIEVEFVLPPEIALHQKKSLSISSMRMKQLS